MHPNFPPHFTMPRTESTYSPVATDEADTEKLLSQPATAAAEWSYNRRGNTLKNKLSRWLPWILHAVLLSISLLIFFDAHWVKNNQCTEGLNVYCRSRSQFERKVEERLMYYDRHSAGTGGNRLQEHRLRRCARCAE